MSDVELQATLRAQVFTAIDTKKATFLESVPAESTELVAKAVDVGINAVLSTLDEQGAAIAIVVNEEVGPIELTGEGEQGLAASYYAHVNN